MTNEVTGGVWEMERDIVEKTHHSPDTARHLNFKIVFDFITHFFYTFKSLEINVSQGDTTCSRFSDTHPPLFS